MAKRIGDQAFGFRFSVQALVSDLRKSDLLLSCSRSPTLRPMPAS
jgi:hypothetical protein